jgi:hypothetical protein
MVKVPVVAAVLGAVLLTTGCNFYTYQGAKYLGSQVIIDKDGNRIEESRWVYPDGKEVTVVDITPRIASNLNRRSEPPPRLLDP